MFTNKKREGINRFVCDASLYVAKTPKASIKYHKPPLPIIPCGIVAYGFVGQPFSKQLYSSVRSINHFTVVFLVTRPLNGNEAGGDLVLIQTSLLLLCKSSCSYAN